MIEEKIENISEEELEFMECFHTPRCLIESYFHNFDSLGSFNSEVLGNIRLYQLPMISYEPTIDTENYPGLSALEKFNLKKTVGDCYNFGARKYGKSLCGMRLDLMVRVIHSAGEQIGFTSVSDEKIRTVLDDVSEGLENHPFYKMYNVKCKRSPYNIRLNNGCRVIGINMNIGKKNAGEQFTGKHYRTLYLEESSQEIDAVYEKRKDSTSELGCVIRQSSMCNFTEHSPAGKQYYDPDNRNKVINYPQFVNPIGWNEREKQSKIKDFGGTDSWFWKTFVEGEVLTDGVSEIDMERVRVNYDKKKTVKEFVLRKDKYKKFKDIIIVEKPSNADEIYIAADIGDGRGGTEITIFSKVGKKFVYLYNITLYSFTDEEQYEIFKWLGQKLGANVIALDNGDGTGRAIFRRLEKIFPKECLVSYSGKEKIAVDYEKDDNGNVKYEKGKPITKDEVMASWGFLYLRDMLYESKIIMPLQYKLDRQLSQVISLQSKDGTRRRYFCGLEDNHLFDTFRVFAIAVWLKEGLNLKQIKQEWGIGSFGNTNNKKTEKRDFSESVWGIGTF